MRGQTDMLPAAPLQLEAKWNLIVLTLFVKLVWKYHNE